jgi:hypothetical protein
MVSKFEKFLKMRFPGTPKFSSYANEWRERLKKGDAWALADSHTRRAIKKAGFVMSKMKTPKGLMQLYKFK